MPEPETGKRKRLLEFEEPSILPFVRAEGTTDCVRGPWLAESKRIFGEPFRDSASFDGLPFILPLLTSASLLQALPDVRKKWFELFDGYWIESKPDKGLLLVLKDPDFDPELTSLLKQMSLDGYTYRSAR